MAPGLFIGLGPGVIEDVFTLTVRLHIERHDRRHGTGFIAQAKVLRSPTLPLDRATSLLGSIKEVVGDEGIAVGPGAGIPRFAPDFLDPAGHLHRRV